MDESVNDWKKIFIDTPDMWPKMTHVNLEDAHKDVRGSIQSLVNIPMKNISLITSVKGSVRSNHYHKTDWHFCYVLEGEIDYYHRKVGDKEAPKLEKIKKDELFFTPPMVEHAMVFHKDTSFLTLGGNSRVQTEYEADLVRIELVSPENVFK